MKDKPPPAKLFRVVPFAQGYMETFKYQVVMGKKMELGRPFENVLDANDLCNQANEVAEDWFRERK